MSLFAHLESLEAKHGKLESAIFEESSRPMPDFMYITMLKKQKLLIKEEIERIAAMPRQLEGAGA